MYVVILIKLIVIPIHLFRMAQVALLTNTKILAKYSDFLDIFSSDSVVELLEHIRVNDYFINLFEDK